MSKMSSLFVKSTPKRSCNFQGSPYLINITRLVCLLTSSPRTDVQRKNVYGAIYGRVKQIKVRPPKNDVNSVKTKDAKLHNKLSVVSSDLAGQGYGGRGYQVSSVVRFV